MLLRCHALHSCQRTELSGTTCRSLRGNMPQASMESFLKRKAPPAVVQASSKKAKPPYPAGSGDPAAAAAAEVQQPATDAAAGGACVVSGGPEGPGGELGALLTSPSWRAALAADLAKPSFKKLDAFWRAERQLHAVFPEPENIFRCMNSCPVDAVRVCILGQDPYHTPGAAMGLSFSVPRGVPVPPSLRNIYREINTDLGLAAPKHGCLQGWADQGVLLLNTALTGIDSSEQRVEASVASVSAKVDWQVRAHEANSHAKQGWIPFTDAVIRALSSRRKGLVFLLWGKPAQQKSALIDSRKHHILSAAHPSGLSAHKGFYGCRHFSQANAWLDKEGMAPINWQLD